MTGKVGLRMRQAATAGVLVGAVLGVPVVTAGAASAAPQVLDIAPGESFTLSGGDCAWDDEEGEDSYGGEVVVGLIDIDDIELEVPRVTLLPNRGKADAEGDWTVTNVVPQVADGDYVAAPVCTDPEDPTNEPYGMEAGAKILQVRTAPPPSTPTTEAPAPPTLPPDFADKAKPKAKPKPVKVSPKFTG